MANSVSKTCRTKVRVMVAVMTCGSRMVTADSSTTVIAFAAARALRGLISDTAPNAAPAATTVLRPKPLRMHTPYSAAGRVAAIGQKEKRADPPAFRQEDRPESLDSVRRFAAISAISPGRELGRRRFWSAGRSPESLAAGLARPSER